MFAEMDAPAHSSADEVVKRNQNRLESTAVSPHTTSKIFVIGGTGAQGMPIIRALVADKKYSARFLTRDPMSLPLPPELEEDR